MIALLLACAGSTEDSEAVDAPWKPEGGEVVTLRARDGVSIVADYYAASGPERPALVLVHMNPAGPWTRADWPGDFLQLLVDEDLALMVPDRRGAGDSGGVAEDAFETVAGAWDIEACVARLQEDGFSSLGLVAASNGTTSALDYIALGEAEGWPAVEAAVLLSVVGATTHNSPLEALPAIPVHFAYPVAEEANQDRWRAANPGTWSFQVYDPGAHGTRMFETTPQLSTDLHTWLVARL